MIPPNKNLAILHGRLQLLDLNKSRGVNLPIDSFFTSLSQDQGSDGTQGLKAIKAENGMVMVQDEDLAKYNGMPGNAIDTGLADYVLAAEEMPKHLIMYISDTFKKSTPIVFDGEDEQQDTNYLQKIFIILIFGFSPAKHTSLCCFRSF